MKKGISCGEVVDMHDYSISSFLDDEMHKAQGSRRKANRAWGMEHGVNAKSLTL